MRTLTSILFVLVSIAIMIGCTAAAPGVVNQPKEPVIVNQPQEPVVVNQPEAPTTVNQPTAPTTVSQPTAPTTVNQPEGPTTINQPEGPTTINQPEAPTTINQPQAPTTINQPTGPVTINDPAGTVTIVCTPTNPNPACPPTTFTASTNVVITRVSTQQNGGGEDIRIFMNGTSFIIDSVVKSGNTRTMSYTFKWNNKSYTVISRRDAQVIPCPDNNCMLLNGQQFTVEVYYHDGPIDAPVYPNGQVPNTVQAAWYRCNQNPNANCEAYRYYQWQIVKTATYRVSFL